MKITVFGAGAIGGYLAGLLARAGRKPALIARGETLTAIQANGLTVERPGEPPFTVDLTATDDPARLGPQDMVLIATKAHQIKDALPVLTPLLGPDTAVVPAINGIPWWYCKGLDGPLHDRDLASCDPSGAIAAAIPVEQVIGMVVYLATHCPEPGRVVSVGPQRLVIGAATPGGRAAGMVAGLGEALDDAGFTVDRAENIRTAVWTKLLGNVHSNPLSVAAEATVIDMLRDPGMRSVSRKIMSETAAVAARLGVDFPVTIDSRLEEAEKLGAFRSSMLQDYDRTRPIELDAILGVVAELGRALGVSTETIDTVYAIVRLRAALHGCYQPPS